MYGPDEGSNDLDRYFKVIEGEAKELRNCNPQGGHKPSFNKNRNSDAGYSGGENNYSSSSRYNENSGDSYGRSNGYGGSNSRSNGYGGNSNKYGGGSDNYGSNSNGGSNYGANGYGSRPNDSYGNGSNSYGGGSSKNDDNTLYYGNAASNAAKASSNNYGNSSSAYGSNSANQNSGSNYGSSRDISGSGFNSNSQPAYGSSSNFSANEDWGAAPQESGYGGSDMNKPFNPNEEQNQQQSYGAPRNQPANDVSEDIDGYQRLDFNRCLISYNEPTSLAIRHIFLNILSRSDLMEYTAKIMECSSQDKCVLAIQRDNQLAESYASQLRSRGFWAFEVTNKTAEPAKLLQQHSVYRCAVTTMSYLRDNVDAFQFPSIVINFDHVVSHVKFLERFLNYRNPAGAEPRDCYIYEMCFNHSTTSQNLKEFIQNQSK